MKTLLKSASDTQRFAIYFAPEIGSNLHNIGSEWLGRDSSSGKAIKQPNIKGISSSYLYSVTKTPRQYGFHATLKAPFRLNKEFTLEDLCSQIHRLSAISKPFHINLKVQKLGNFIALMMNPHEQQMQNLASMLVEDLDQFRTPLHQKEIDKRKTEKGKGAQQDKLNELLKFFSADNKVSLVRMFQLQKLIVLAKLKLINSLNRLGSINTFVRTRNGYKVTGAEGYVAIDQLGGDAVKIVDRMEFSYNNFSADILKGWEKPGR